MTSKSVLIVVLIVFAGVVGGWFLVGNKGEEGSTAAKRLESSSDNLGGGSLPAPEGVSNTSSGTSQPSSGSVSGGIQSSNSSSGSGSSGIAPTPTAAAAAVTVSASIKGFAFAPATITIKKGDTVVWTNQDSAPHTVTGSQDGFSSGSFDSGNMSAGATYNHTFTSAGTFSYRCAYHPGMRATVVVTE